MEEALPKSGGFNHGACRLVHRFAADAWTHVIRCRLMRLLQDRVAVKEVVGWGNGTVRAGHPDRARGV